MLEITHRENGKVLGDEPFFHLDYHFIHSEIPFLIFGYMKLPMRSTAIELQIGIFSSISLVAFLFSFNVFLHVNKVFFPTKQWIQLFCCRLKRFPIVGDLSLDVCRLSHNKWIETNSTTWKCKNSARRHTICECSKCRIVWCDFPLSSTHRHWKWLLTGDLSIFFLRVCSYVFGGNVTRNEMNQATTFWIDFEIRVARLMIIQFFWQPYSIRLKNI